MSEAAEIKALSESYQLGCIHGLRMGIDRWSGCTLELVGFSLIGFHLAAGHQ